MTIEIRWPASAREAPDGRRGARAGQSDLGGNPPESNCEALYAYVKEQLAGPELHSEEIQYELGRWIHLLETREEDLNGKAPKGEVLRRLEREAGAAIPALLSAKPDPVFARTLRVQAEICLLRHNGWLTRFLLWMTGGSPVQTVCVGVSGAAFVGLVAAVLWLQDVPIVRPLTPLDAQIAIAAAFLGGLVSVMTRLQGFARLTDFEHVFQFVNAFARPFIGAAFGVFAFAALKSGLIPIDEKLLSNLSSYGIWTIAFAAGFSERIGPALITRAEGLLSSSKK